jgi:hypothetical protein
VPALECSCILRVTFRQVHEWCCRLQVTQQHPQRPGDSVGAGQQAVVGHQLQVCHSAGQLRIHDTSYCHLHLHGMWLTVHVIPAGTSRPGTAQPAALATLQELQQQDIVFLDAGTPQLQTLGSDVQTHLHQQQGCSSAGLQQLSATGFGAPICNDSSQPWPTTLVQPAQHTSMHSSAEVGAIHTQAQSHGTCLTRSNALPARACWCAGATCHAAGCAGCTAAS